MIPDVSPKKDGVCGDDIDEGGEKRPEKIARTFDGSDLARNADVVAALNNDVGAAR